MLVDLNINSNIKPQSQSVFFIRHSFQQSCVLGFLFFKKKIFKCSEASAGLSQIAAARRVD